MSAVTERPACLLGEPAIVADVEAGAVNAARPANARVCARMSWKSAYDDAAAVAPVSEARSGAEHVELAGILERKTADQDRVDEREHRRVDADAERQRDDGHR